MIIEWLPGSDDIGDFTWASFDEYIIVQERVREAFLTRFSDIEFHPIQMIQDPKVKRPIQMTKRTKPRVWLPYEGPQLWRMQATTRASLDLERSRYKIEKVCGTCGTVFYNTPPHEEIRKVVDPSTWSGAPIFYMGGSAGAVYCTEEVKVFVEERGFTNVSFREAGIIPSEELLSR